MAGLDVTNERWTERLKFNGKTKIKLSNDQKIEEEKNSSHIRVPTVKGRSIRRIGIGARLKEQDMNTYQ